MKTRELIQQLQGLDPDAEVLIVDPEGDYQDEPHGPYSSIEERIDNESTFAVSIREIEGYKVIEIGSIAPFV